MFVRSPWTFAIGLLTGLAVVCAALLSSVAKASDSWVAVDIEHKAAFRE